MSFTRDRRGSRSADLDVLPEADALGGWLHCTLRRLVDPGGAGVAIAAHDHVVELDAVRALLVVVGLGRLLEPVEAHRGAGEIVVAAALDDVGALGDGAAVHGGFHGGYS